METKQRVGWSGVRNLVGTKNLPLLQRVQTGLRPIHLPIQWVTGFFPWGKAAGA